MDFSQIRRKLKNFSATQDSFQRKLLGLEILGKYGFLKRTDSSLVAALVFQ